MTTGFGVTWIQVLFTGVAAAIAADLPSALDTLELPKVAVYGKVAISRVEPGKVVYLASDLPSQNGGTAGDLLKSMMSVSMGGSPNHNRDVRFRGLGNGYSRILIDGRETGLSGNNRETVLDQIPAGSVERIEIQSSPGSDQPADGINGIIHIILKKAGPAGLNGKIDLLRDSQEGFNGGVTWGYKGEGWDAYGSMDRLDRQVENDKDVDKRNFRNGVYDGSQVTDQYENKRFSNEALRLGGKRNLWGQATLATEFLYGRQIEDKLRNLDATGTTAVDAFKDRSTQSETDLRRNRYYDFSGEFRQRFQGGADLKVRGGYADADQKRGMDARIQRYQANGAFLNTQPNLQHTDELVEDDNVFLQADAQVRPLDALRLKAGARSALLKRNIDATLVAYDYASSTWKVPTGGADRFRFGEDTHAAYLLAASEFGSLSGEVGMRWEYTALELQSPDQGTQKNSEYHLPLPQASVTWRPDSSQHVTAAFGRRVRRPAYKDMNPYEDRRDPLKTKTGNPNLKPELAWTYEVGYLKSFGPFHAGANVFYRDLHDLIQKEIREGDDGVLSEKPFNVSRAHLGGIELMTSAKLASWWEAGANYSYFDSEVYTSEFTGDAIKDQVDWSAKVTSDFKLPWKTRLQIIGSFLGPKPSSQSKEDEQYFVDLGIEQPIGRGGTLLLRVADAFDSVRKSKEVETSASVTTETENTQGRIVSGGVRWAF